VIQAPEGTVVAELPETAARRMAEARDAVIKDLNAGALVVSSRHVRLILDGFDSMMQHISTGHEHYEEDCDKIVKLRMGVAMRALGVDSMSLREEHYDELSASKASLSQHYDESGKVLTYTLTYPPQTPTPDHDTATLVPST
jgi:hypothetical protein